MSQGTTTYIDALQEDTLSSYPLTLQAQSMDLGCTNGGVIGAAGRKADTKIDAVYQKPMVYDLVNALNSFRMALKTDLRSFKSYLEETPGGY